MRAPCVDSYNPASLPHTEGRTPPRVPFAPTRARGRGGGMPRLLAHVFSPRQVGEGCRVPRGVKDTRLVHLQTRTAPSSFRRGGWLSFSPFNPRRGLWVTCYLFSRTQGTAAVSSCRHGGTPGIQRKTSSTWSFAAGEPSIENGCTSLPHPAGPEPAARRSIGTPAVWLPRGRDRGAPPVFRRRPLPVKGEGGVAPRRSSTLYI